MSKFNYHPNSSLIDPQGELIVGGYKISELAERFGTPLYVLDEQTIREVAREYKQALDEFYPNNLPIFASKALSIQAVFAILQQEGFGLDVVSAGELFTAKSINFPENKIYLHGNNKSEEELRMACESKGTKIIIDNFHEIKLLQKIGKPIDILLRVTPGVECHTHEYIKTGHLDSKFGFDLEQLDDAIELILGNKNINLIGLHSHIGSQIFEITPYKDAARILIENFAKIRDKYGITLSELNIGGGLGIHYTNQDDPPNIRETFKQVTDSIKSNLDESGLPYPKLLIEPGRSIVGRAGVTVYTLGANKKVPEGKHYFAVDGGMADNPRPITYQAQYSAIVANKADEQADTTYTIAGRYCESGDILLKEIKLPTSLEAGDLLTVFGTGAYNYSMSSHYNRVPKPCMVLVHDGEAEIIVKRETLEDLIQNDILPPRLSEVKERV
jgi:diaminopimelate decarboxylase